LLAAAVVLPALYGVIDRRRKQDQEVVAQSDADENTD